MAKNNETNVTIINSINDQLLSTVSTNLKKLMEQNNLTQGKLAEETLTSKAAVNGYVNGNSIPNLPFMVALKHLYGISIDDFLTKNINPEEYVPAEASEADKHEYEIASKYLGSYYTYYYDTSNYKGRDNNDASESLRYGVIYIYENPGPMYRSTYSCTSILGLSSIDDAKIIKNKIDSFNDAGKAVDYIAQNHSSNMYHGNFELGEKHVFITMDHHNKDKVLAIFYKVNSNKSSFRGGMGTINSVSKGRESMPTIQFIGISRDWLTLSAEEIHQVLLLHYPTFRAEGEAQEMIDLFNRLYMSPENSNGRELIELSDLQKAITIKANLERYIKNSLKKNMFRYGKISNRDDDEWYHLLKDFTEEESV